MSGGAKSWNGIAQVLIEPVLRFCFRRSVKLKELIELVKTSLVKIAQEELVSRGEQASVSRISLLTGVHRKDVTVLIKDLTPRDTRQDVVRRLIGQWRSDKRFTNSRGPRDLTFVGEGSEYAQLVLLVNREVNAYSLLFVLREEGIVQERKGLLHLVRHEYTPSGKAEEGFSILARDIHDLLSAGEENILDNPKIPHLQLSTSYDNVSVEKIEEIREWFLQEGAAFHERVRNYVAQHDKDINPAVEGEGGGRVTLGTFSFVQDPPEGDDSKES